MILEVTDKVNTCAQVYRLTLCKSDLIFVNLDPIDRALIHECEASNSVADKLLALECITRRIEQQRTLEAPHGL